MGTSTCGDQFKRDAVQQIRGRGYPVREASRLLGERSHSLYKWMKLFAEPAPKVSGVDHEAENRRLKRKLARVTEEREPFMIRRKRVPTFDKYALVRRHLCHNCTRRKRSALVMTDTDDRLIAAAAIIGDSRVPVNGYSTPAATGMPMAL